MVSVPFLKAIFGQDEQFVWFDTSFVSSIHENCISLIESSAASSLWNSVRWAMVWALFIQDTPNNETPHVTRKVLRKGTIADDTGQVFRCIAFSYL